MNLLRLVLNSYRLKNCVSKIFELCSSEIIKAHIIFRVLVLKFELRTPRNQKGPGEFTHLGTKKIRTSQSTRWL